MNPPVIFAPDLIGAAFIDPEARRVVDRWRHGAFKIVMNRELLVLHVKVLAQLGLSAELIRRWNLWFTAPDRSIFFPDLTFPTPSSHELCETLARATKTENIISSLARPSPPSEVKWLQPRQLI